MDEKRLRKIERCLEAMKPCLEIAGVEHCVCFSDALAVLFSESQDFLKKRGRGMTPQDKKRLDALSEEIRKIKSGIADGEKKCLGCVSCAASLVFKEYPRILNRLYLAEGL